MTRASASRVFCRVGKFLNRTAERRVRTPEIRIRNLEMLRATRNDYGTMARILFNGAIDPESSMLRSDPLVEQIRVFEKKVG